MRYTIKLVEDALDAYLKTSTGRKLERVRASTLAYIVGVDTGVMSPALQEYVKTLGTRYTIGCEGYGSTAQWVILDAPGKDRKAAQEARLRHSIWVVRDSLRRLVKDTTYEVKEASRGTSTDQVIDQEIDDYLKVSVPAAEVFVRRVESLRVPTTSTP
jgi:hypothetical protein